LKSLIFFEKTQIFSTLSLKSLIFTGKTNDFLKRIFDIFDFPIFDQNPIIPLEAVPKKSKKRQAKT